MKNFITRIISHTLMLSVLSMSILASNAQAAMITSDQLASSQTASLDRERLHSFFDRADVQAQLQARGVSSEVAKSRVDALTDNEVASLSGQLDNLPAGGVDVVGFLLLIFIVLIITDVLGLTKVFSFTKSARR